MFVRSPMYRRHAGLAALSAGLTVAALVTGCSSLTNSGQAGAIAKQQVHLQPALEQGPDPFTPSTATVMGAAGKLPVPRASASAGSFRSIRTVLGSTPGLYGGRHSVASCDVEQQIRFLMADGNKGRAFAHGAGVSQEDIPAFLRGLTPVVLRADARVTGHGYRDGAAHRFQAVLQGGTAVLVDEQGSPRVRCASGSPVASPVVDSADPEEQGKAWPGYDRGRVVVITRAAQMIDSLIIADMASNSWLARKSGTDGEADRAPEVPPTYDPGLHVTEVPESQSAGPYPQNPNPSGSSTASPNAQNPNAASPGAVAPKPIVPDANPSGRQGVPTAPDGNGSGGSGGAPEPAPVPDGPIGGDQATLPEGGSTDGQSDTEGSTVDGFVTGSDDDVLFGPGDAPRSGQGGGQAGSPSSGRGGAGTTAPETTVPDVRPNAVPAPAGGGEARRG
ncbi:DUF6777 domain-containing protein [Streptomyces sp. NPDC059909]|uniref:DUF6777 domain-containing protein n=1 Tax=Streptomyces sp. NPDC059909 TaxID=3346998 RepID=UPI003663627E